MQFIFVLCQQGLAQTPMRSQFFGIVLNFTTSNVHLSHQQQETMSREKYINILKLWNIYILNPKIFKIDPLILKFNFRDLFKFSLQHTIKLRWRRCDDINKISMWQQHVIYHLVILI